MSIVGVGETAYVVSGDEVWEMGEGGGLVRDEARSIATTWPGLPRYPDAGFTWHNGLEYIFIGRACWLKLCSIVTLTLNIGFVFVFVFSFIFSCQTKYKKL